MKKFLQKILGDKLGASAAEYALILAIFGGAVVVGVTYLGESFNNTMTTAGGQMDDAGGTSFQKGGTGH